MIWNQPGFALFRNVDCVFSRMSARFKILSSRATMWSWCAKSTLPTSNNYSTWGALVIWRHQWSGSTIHDNDQTDNQYVYTVMYRHMTGNYWHTHMYIYIIYIHILYTYTRADACLHTHIHNTVYICTYVYACIYVTICMYVCMYVM